MIAAHFVTTFGLVATEIKAFEKRHAYVQPSAKLEFGTAEAAQGAAVASAIMPKPSLPAGIARQRCFDLADLCQHNEISATRAEP